MCGVCVRVCVCVCACLCVCLCACVCVFIYTPAYNTQPSPRLNPPRGSTLPASYGKLGFRVSQARARRRDKGASKFAQKKKHALAYAGDPDCAWMGSPITTIFGFAIRCSIITRLSIILAGTRLVISLRAVPPFMPVRLPRKLASVGVRWPCASVHTLDSAIHNRS